MTSHKHHIAKSAVLG